MGGAPGKFVEAWAYNGVVPGPEIRVTEGDKVRVVVKNELPESTAVHWHGLMVPNAMDGVPFITQPPIKPGETFTYEFVARQRRLAHVPLAPQRDRAGGRGLLGAFIVEPKDPATRPAFDREYTMVLNDGPLGGFTLNGKSFPATQPLTAKQGERVLIRYMNEGMMIHPMHLHGMPMQVIAKDGYLLPQPYMCDTLNVAPGERCDVIVEATEAGRWAFHCHILSHAESDARHVRHGHGAGRRGVGVVPWIRAGPSGRRDALPPPPSERRSTCFTGSWSRLMALRWRNGRWSGRRISRALPMPLSTSSA